MNTKTKILSGITLSAIVVALFSLKSCNEGVASVQPSITADAVPMSADRWFSALSKETDTPYKTFKLRAGTDTVLKHTSGTSIYISACSFADSNGNAISGEVQLNYREFLNKESILGAGIPMRLNDSDYNQYLISAGMMEISASQNGKPLLMNKNCPLKLEMINTSDARGFNLYYLDTLQKGWIEKEKDVAPTIYRRAVNIVKAIGNKKKVTEKEALKNGYINPVKPKVASKNRFQFKFKINLQPFPELNVYDGIEWEYAGNKRSEDPDKNTWVKTQLWDEVELLPTNTKGLYRLRLTAGEKVFTTTVKPVFDSEDMEYAMDVYNYRYGKYRAFIEKNKKIKQDYHTKTQSIQIITRSFEIDRFGIWNCDKLEQVDQPQPMMVQFMHADSSLRFEKAWLLIADKKAVIDISIAKNTTQKFLYPSLINSRLLVTDHTGRCYIFDINEIKSKNAVNETIRFKVQKEGILAKNHDELKKLMG